MSKQMMLVFAVCGVLGATNAARADEIAGLYGNLMETWYRASVDGFPDGIPSAYDSRYEPGQCAKQTASEKKNGTKPTDTFVGNYKGHPKAKPVGDQFSVPFSEAPAICTAFEAQLKIGVGVTAIQKMAAYMKDKPSAPTAETAKGYNTGAGESIVTQGKDCIATIDAMINGGAAPTKTMKVATGAVALQDLRKTCQAAIDYGTAFEGFIAAEQKAKRREKAQKYVDAGVKGAKLELFIEYDDVYWRNAKCEKTDDVAELAKAKVLIHWLENSNGTQTIRRYTFNGNKVSKSEKTYITEAAAQKNCR